MSEEADQELRNLLGQYLVASFQRQKLAEMIAHRVSGYGRKEVRFFIELEGKAPVEVRILLREYRPEASPEAP